MSLRDLWHYLYTTPLIDLILDATVVLAWGLAVILGYILLILGGFGVAWCFEWARRKFRRR